MDSLAGSSAQGGRPSRWLPSACCEHIVASVFVSAPRKDVENASRFSFSTFLP